MKRRLQFLVLRTAIASLTHLQHCTSRVTWQLESIRARLQTKLANLLAHESR